MDDAVIVAIIGGIASVPAGIAAVFSIRGAGHTKPVNGSSMPVQLNDLHHLFVSHVDRDEEQFNNAQVRDGELSESMIALRDYTRNRWHQDDNRFTIMMIMLMTVADPKITAAAKHQLLEEMRQRYADALQWGGNERRNQPKETT